MSQELHDHPWVEAYRQKKDNLSFWEFIDLVRMYNLSTLGPYLVQAYKLYVSDHPKEMLPRLTPEIRQFIEDGAGPLTFGDHSGYNASERLKNAAWQMLHRDIEHSQFNEYWIRAMQRPLILRIPEDDRLNTRNLFGRVHKVCCDFHQHFAQA